MKPVCSTACMASGVIGKGNCVFTAATSHFCSLDHFYQCFRERMKHYYLSSNCIHRCKYFRYEAKLSSLDILEPITVEIFLNSDIFDWNYTREEEIKYNVIKLNVYFPRLEYTRIKQVPAFTFDELISNVGGQLGLFLGASIITMLEIDEFFCSIIGRCCKRNAKISQDNNEVKVHEFRSTKG